MRIVLSSLLVLVLSTPVLADDDGAGEGKARDDRATEKVFEDFVARNEKLLAKCLEEVKDARGKRVKVKPRTIALDGEKAQKKGAKGKRLVLKVPLRAAPLASDCLSRP